MLSPSTSATRSHPMKSRPTMKASANARGESCTAKVRAIRIATRRVAKQLLEMNLVRRVVMIRMSRTPGQRQRREAGRLLACRRETRKMADRPDLPLPRQPLTPKNCVLTEH
jgi:hypothetical protein